MSIHRIDRDIAKYEKQMQLLLRKLDPMHRSEIVRINVSSTFLARTRCKGCGKIPDFYYYIRNPFHWVDPHTSIAVGKWRRHWIKSMSTSWYVGNDPRFSNKLGDFTFILEGRQYVPTAHRVRGLPEPDKNNVTEILTCSRCQTINWAFNQKSAKSRPEIMNRKGKYNYPRKFEY